jgi:hypothetical protein
VRNAHVAVPPILVNPRYAMSLMRGPMTRVEIRAARGVTSRVAMWPAMRRTMVPAFQRASRSSSTQRFHKLVWWAISPANRRGLGLDQQTNGEIPVFSTVRRCVGQVALRLRPWRSSDVSARGLGDNALRRNWKALRADKVGE